MCLQNDVFTPKKAGGKVKKETNKTTKKPNQNKNILKTLRVQTYFLDDFKSSNPPAKFIVYMHLKHTVLLQTERIIVPQWLLHMYLCVHLPVMTKTNKKGGTTLKYLLNTKTSLKLLKHSVACAIHILGTKKKFPFLVISDLRS